MVWVIDHLDKYPISTENARPFSARQLKWLKHIAHNDAVFVESAVHKPPRQE